MRIELQRKLFAGVKIDNKLREALATCAPRDKVYFDGTDSRYLLVLRAVEDSYVGKIVDAGLPAASFDDLKRNVLSILGRISNGRRGEDDVKLFAVDEGEPPPLLPKEPSSYDRY